MTIHPGDRFTIKIEDEVETHFYVGALNAKERIAFGWIFTKSFYTGEYSEPEPIALRYLCGKDSINFNIVSIGIKDDE